MNNLLVYLYLCFVKVSYSMLNPNSRHNQYSIWKGLSIPLENLDTTQETSQKYSILSGSIATPGFSLFEVQPGRAVKLEGSKYIMENPMVHEPSKKIFKEEEENIGQWETSFPKLPTRDQSVSKKFNKHQNEGLQSDTSLQNNIKPTPGSALESENAPGKAVSNVLTNKDKDSLSIPVISQPVLENKVKPDVKAPDVLPQSNVRKENLPAIFVKKESKTSRQNFLDHKAAEEIFGNQAKKEVHSNKLEDSQIIPECQPNETISHSDHESRNIGKMGLVKNPGDLKQKLAEKGKLLDNLGSESPPKETLMGENNQLHPPDADQNTDLVLQENDLIAEDNSKKIPNEIFHLNNEKIEITPILVPKPTVTRTKRRRRKSTRKLLEESNSQPLPSKPTTSRSVNFTQNEVITKAEMIDNAIQAHDTEEGADIPLDTVEISKDEETKSLEGSTSDEQKALYPAPSENTRRKNQKANKIKTSSKKPKNLRKQAAIESMMKASEPDTTMKASEPDTSEVLTLYSQCPEGIMSQREFDVVFKQILKIPADVFMRHALKFDDKRQNIKIEVTNIQFAYYLQTNLMGDKDRWFSTSDRFQFEFGDIKEAYRRILSFAAQCVEMRFVYNFENKKHLLSQNSVEFGKLFKFDEFFPNFLDFGIGEWEKANLISQNIHKVELYKLINNSAIEMEKRKASMFMMNYDSTYRNSKFLKDAVSNGFLNQGAILSLMGTISHALDLSSKKVKWETLKKDEVINRVNRLINAMHGTATLQMDLTFPVFEHTWVEEYTRSIFVNEEGISNLFQERLKNLAILADDMGIKASDLGEQDDGLQKLTAGELLIANHVGLKPELLIEFKVWLKSGLNTGRKSSRVLGNWNAKVPKKCWEEGHTFIEYFQYRKEKISGLENWKITYPLNPVNKEELEKLRRKTNTDNLDESIKSCLKYLDF